jgi:hypothetical protein
VTRRPQFAEQAAGHPKCPEIGVTKCPLFAKKLAGKTFRKNPVTNRSQFAKQVAGHHKCPKIMRQNVDISLKSRLDIAKVFGKIL